MSEPLQAVPVRYSHSADLAELLERLGVSLLLSTYQAGRVVTVDTELERVWQPSTRAVHGPATPLLPFWQNWP